MLTALEPPAERRAHTRLVLNLRCVNANTRHRADIGRTLNVSRTGMLIVWNAAAEQAAPQVGDQLKIDVELPASQAPRRCIRCGGRVVRTQVIGFRTVQIALALTHMSLRDADPAALPVRRLDEPPVRKKYAGFVM
jgi:hypothetical protein